jgi:hypothetical protein
MTKAEDLGRRRTNLQDDSSHKTKPSTQSVKGFWGRMPSRDPALSVYRFPYFRVPRGVLRRAAAQRPTIRVVR